MYDEEQLEPGDVFGQGVRELDLRGGVRVRVRVRVGVRVRVRVRCRTVK